MKARAALTQWGEEVVLGLPLCLNLLSLYYQNRVGKELKVAYVTCGDRVLCIGGGPCPFTSIHIHKLTGAHITIIDNNPQAVRIGERLIRKLGLLSAISFVHADGARVDVHEYALVHVALQVTPRTEVLRHIQREARADAMLLVRGTLPSGTAGLEPGWRASAIAGLPFYPTMLLKRQA